MAPLPPRHDEIKRFHPNPATYWFLLRMLVEIVMGSIDPNMTFRDRRSENKFYARNDVNSNDMQHVRDVVIGGYSTGYDFASKNKIRLVEVGQCEALTKLHARSAFDLWKSKYVGPCSDSKFDVFELSFSRGIRKYSMR